MKKQKASLRLRFWFWLTLGVFKVQFGDKMPRPLRWLSFFLFPVDTYIKKRELKIYDPQKDVYTLHRVRISGHLIRFLAAEPLNRTVKILSRADGVITVKEVAEGPKNTIRLPAKDGLPRYVRKEFPYKKDWGENDKN